MVDDDRALRIALDALLPKTEATGDWERVLRDAKISRLAGLRLQSAARRRRRVVLAGAFAALVALVPLTALAAANDWWFFDTPLSTPSPTGDVVVVDQGQWDGIPWALTAYGTQSQGLCVAVTPDPPDPPVGNQYPTASGSALGCALGRGSSGSPDSTSPPEMTLVSAAYTGTDGAEVDILAGVAATDVAQIETLTTAGAQVTAETIPSPTELGTAVRFFVMRLPAGSSAAEVSAIDASGNLLQQVKMP